MITQNTGTTASSGAQVTTQAITIPAGVLGGDVVLMKADIIVLTVTPPVISASSTGTTPSLAGSEDSGTEALPAAVTGAVFYFVAAGTTGSASSDAGKIVTFSAGGVVSGFWAIALEAYTGASTSGPIDVIQGAFGGAGVNSVTCPVLMTTKANDWAIFLGGGAAEGSGFTVPSGSTSRQLVESSADVAAAISDSNGSAGAAGASIGGGSFTCNTAANSILIAFTVGLAPAGIIIIPAKSQLVRAKLPPVFRGRVSTGSRTLARNPVAGPSFHRLARPVRAALPVFSKGRIYSGSSSQVPGHALIVPAASRSVRAKAVRPVRGHIYSNPGVPLASGSHGPVIYPLQKPVRSPVPRLSLRGHTAGSGGMPLLVPPPFFSRISSLPSPVRSRPDLPLRGRTAGNPGGPIQNPPPVTSSALYQQVSPARARVFLPPRGRSRSGPGAPVHNPTTGPAVSQLHKSARIWPASASRAGRCISTAVPQQKPGAGPPLMPARQVVRGPVLTLRRGTATGTRLAPVPVPTVTVGAAPGQPLRIRPQLPVRGRSHSSRLTNQLPPPVTVVRLPHQPVIAKLPAGLARGRAAGSPGSLPQNPRRGPLVYPLHGPVGSSCRAPGPYRKGHIVSNPGSPPVTVMVRQPIFSIQLSGEVWATGALCT
jgi:hypothetical protein